MTGRSRMSYWLESPPTWRPAEAEYFASDNVGSSALALFARDREAFVRGAQIEMTDAMLRGRVIDCAMLEPELLSARYGLETDALQAAIDWGHRETALVPEAVLKAAGVSVTALCGNALALSLLCGPGLSQVCHRWTHPSGIEVRMRLDRAIDTAKGGGVRGPEVVGRRPATNRELHLPMGRTPSGGALQPGL